MRDIKFRAWDDKNKKMVGPFEVGSALSMEWPPQMQYTGLKDKNGVEIYEGDLATDMVGDIFEVFYNTVNCAYMAKYTHAECAEKTQGYFRLGDQWMSGVEVIGNIYSDSDLLKILTVGY